MCRSAFSARMLGAGRVLPDARWQTERGAHGFHELIFVMRGRIRVTLRDQMIEGRRGDVLLYPAGAAHAEQSVPEDPLESCFVAFLWPALPADVPACIRDARGRLRLLADWLCDEWMRHDPDRNAMCRAFFLGLLEEWRHLLLHRDTDVVVRVRGYVQQHAPRRITLDELAGVAGMSKYHFIRTYRRLTGRTPMADVRMERLRQAQHLLITTTLPLKEIAPRVGLGDEYHLGHVFRRHLGGTPGAFRAGRSTPRA